MMKKIRELLKEKRWKWTAGGIACLAGAAVIFALSSGMGVHASINLGGVNIPTDGSAYLISTESELKALGNASEHETVNKTFKMVNDINVSSITSPATGTFAGVFDGNGHVITYENIQIEMTDEEAAKSSKVHGLLFGTLGAPGTVSGGSISTGGVVQNVIIDIKDNDATYVRNVKNAPVESGTNIVYEENYGPLFTGTVNGLDNLEKAEEIHAALQESGTTVSGNNLTQTYQENGVQVTSYAEDPNPGTDYFGLICGANHGEISQVYLTGNQVSIGRNELTSQNYSEKNQNGYRTETYNYTKEIVSSEETAISDELSLLGTAYINDSKTYNAKPHSMSVSVSAPKAFANGETIVYEILVKNNGTVDYDSVTLKSSSSGNWGKVANQIDKYNKNEYSINQLAANAETTVYYSCTTSSSGVGMSKTFDAFATADGRPCASVYGEKVNTSLFKTGEKTITKIEDELKIDVTAPQIWSSEEMTYTVKVTNLGTTAYDQVGVTASNNAVTSDVPGGITAGGYKEYRFTYTPSDSEISAGAANVKFSVNAVLNSGDTARTIITETITTTLKNTTAVNTVQGNSNTQDIQMTVSAPKAVESGKEIVYEIQLKNDGNITYNTVTLKSDAAGKWGADSNGLNNSGDSYTIYNLSKNNPKSIYFSCEAPALEGSVSRIFEAFASTGGKVCSSVKVEDVTTTVIANEENVESISEDTTVTKSNSSKQNIQLSVSAPKTYANGKNIVYEILVNNTGTITYDTAVLNTGVSGSWGDTKDSLTASGTSYTIANLVPGVPKTVYFSMETPSSGTTLARTFTISAVTEGKAYATAEAKNVTTALFNPTYQTSTKTEKGLTITVEAPEQWGKNAIPYTVTVKNEGSMTYHNVSVAANKGQIEGDSNASIASGDTKTFRFVYTPETAETTASVNFSVAAVLHNNDGAKNITTDAITTTVHDSTEQTQSSVMNGIYVSVSAPQVVFNQSGTEVLYTITLTNQDATTYSSVNLTSSEAGVWNESGWAKTTENVTLAANETKVIPFTYQVGEDSNISGLDLDFTATAYTGDVLNRVEKTNTSVTDVKTAVYKGKKLSDTAEFSNEIGLKAKLELKNDKIYAGGGRTLNYTLTLENDNKLPVSGVILSKDIIIVSNLTGWTIESKTGEFAVGTNQILKAGESVILKKNVPMSLTAGNIESEYTESLTMEGKLTTTAYRYTYAGDSASDFIEKAGEVTYSGNPIASGNYLYAGGVSGKSIGNIQEVKQAVELSGAEAANEFVIAGIAAEAENVSAKWSDIYLTGDEDFYGIGSGTPAASVTSVPASAPGENWSSVSKYVEESAGILSTHQEIDLGWLIKNASFTYAAPSGGNMTANLTSDKMTSAPLTYAIAYNARRSLDDNSENNLYLSTDGSLNLAKSGYYRLLNAYATDGYYHYATEMTTLENAAFVYPYNANAPFEIEKQEVKRSNVNPLLDVVEIKLNSDISGKVFFDTNSAGSIPTAEGDEATLQNGVVSLPFDMETDYVSYLIVPVIEEYIYPTLSTITFTQAQKPALPKPEVKAYNYYQASGAKNDYVTFEESTSSQERFYEAGSDLIFIPAEDTTNAESYQFRYKFTTSHDASKWDENQRYTDTSGIDALMDDAAVYEESAFIPNIAGTKNVYLYVEVSKKTYTTQVYCFGPFSVSEEVKLSASINGQTSADYVVLDGDILTITGAPDGTSIQTMITKMPEMSFTGTAYPANGITMRQNAGGYVYARIKYDDSMYGPVQLFDYTFGGICADARITPNTGLSSGGDVAAASIGSTVSVTLSSRTPGAEIFYLVSNASQNVFIERVSEQPADISDAIDSETGKYVDDGKISSDGYKYFNVGGRWYRTKDTELIRYTEGFSLSHDKKDAQMMYVSTIALASNYEPSAELEYIYKVQPAQQVSNPEAAFETRYLPGGESIETALVTKDANISFLSLTPEAELYYAIGSGANIPNTPIPQEGVKVEGNYGDTFVVRVIAKKAGMLDSDVITFVYKISDQEMAIAPTATPGTTADVPTVVIPGDKILLSTTTKEALIFYTTDGSSPKFTENPDGTFSVAEEDKNTTIQYDPNAGIKMPADGSGYFSITAVAVRAGLAKSQEVHFTYSYPGTVLAPYANIDAGKVGLNTSVLLKNLTKDAVIYYTVAHGKDIPEEPTLSSAVFSEEYPFVITEKTTIKAIAVKDGVKSTVVTLVYEPMEQLNAPQPSIASGSVVASGTVLELSVPSGAVVYYTLDGSDPTDTANKAVLSGNVLTLNGEAGGQLTIKAFAKASDRSQSDVATFTYQFSQNIGGITASVENGSLVSNGTKVNLMCDVTDAEIYYTTNGSSPIEKGKKGTIVEIDGTPGTSFTIKAVAIVNGEPGMLTTFIYRIKEKPTAPTASPAGGTLTVAARVTLNAGDAAIYYTIDGTEPTESSTPYTEPVLINHSATLKAIAVSEDGEISEVASYVYTAAAKAAKVTSSVSDGEVLEPGDCIQLSTETENAVIYYSTDGTEPGINNLDSMQIYDGTFIEINRSVTIQAVAYRKDLRISDVSIWNYTVDVIPAVEQKKAEAEKRAEEGLRDTDTSLLDRKNLQEKEISARTIKEKEHKTAVSYTADALPKDVVLVTEKRDTDAYTLKKTKGIYGEDAAILDAFKIKVKEGSSSVQPKEAVEVAFQIPKGYEDAVLSVAMIDQEHNLTSLETRREAGVLYAKTTKLGSYVIIGPERAEEEEQGVPYLEILQYTAGTALAGGFVYFISVKLKKFMKKR